MNKVLIVSDNHRRTKELEIIKSRHNIDEMIHCGDSELNYDATQMAGFHKVRGNTDSDLRYPNELTVRIAGVHFLIIHGHRQYVNRDLNLLSYAADEKGVDVVCYGHTHVARTDKINHTIMINPGSIAQSRSSFPETYAIARWNTLEDLQVEYYNIAGKLVQELDFKK